MSRMEQGGCQANEGQPQQAQQQGAHGEHSQLSPQEQAKAASREALEAQEAIKRAYIKQMAAHEKAEQASHQGQPTPRYQSGFVPYSSAVHNASVQPRAGQEEAVQQGQPQPINQDNQAMLSAQRCQEMLMQGANQIAQTATVQMTAAQNLAASAPNPETQQLARKEAETAQSQMQLAHQITAAAQSPDTAVRAAVSLFNRANQ